MVRSPKVFVDGVSRRDVVQGSLGDCWFLSSCSAVAREKKLIERVSGETRVVKSCLNVHFRGNNMSNYMKNGDKRYFIIYE